MWSIFSYANKRARGATDIRIKEGQDCLVSKPFNKKRASLVSITTSEFWWGEFKKIQISQESPASILVINNKERVSFISNNCETTFHVSSKITIKFQHYKHIKSLHKLSYNLCYWNALRGLRRTNSQYAFEGTVHVNNRKREQGHERRLRTIIRTLSAHWKHFPMIGVYSN